MHEPVLNSDPTGSVASEGGHQGQAPAGSGTSDVGDSAAECVSEIEFFPRLRRGVSARTAVGLEPLIQAAWLLSAEGRAFVEDLEGGFEQPQLQQAVKFRLLELLFEIDMTLAGKAPIEEMHTLALVLELGMSEVAALSPEEIPLAFELNEEVGGANVDVCRVFSFWRRLIAAFPGHLPDPLVPTGQSEMLVALRNWSKLCAKYHVDTGFLEKLLKSS